MNKCFTLLLSLVSFNLCAFETANDKQAYQELNDFAIQAATDKNSFYHDYTKIYSKYFNELKNKPITFLEIGIAEGKSVKMWESYFEKADLHFADIEYKAHQYHSQRSKYHYLDQADVVALRKLGDEVGSFDVIIDDGGHTMVQQITSFQALFPYVKSGGYYIIEDLHTSYWPQWGGSGDLDKAGDGTAVGYLKDLVDTVNYPGAHSAWAGINNLPPHLKAELDYLKANIESIHFYSSVAIILKR